MSTILDILAKIGNAPEYHGWASRYTKPGITRREFTKILMDPSSSPYYQTIRTVSEKWRLLLELDYGKLRNSDLMILDLDRIRRELNIQLEDSE